MKLRINETLLTQVTAHIFRQKFVIKFEIVRKWKYNIPKYIKLNKVIEELDADEEEIPAEELERLINQSQDSDIALSPEDIDNIP